MSDLLSDGLGTSSGPSGFWSGLHPGIRAAIIMWVFLLGISIVNSFTGGASLVFCYPVQLLLYLGNGVLAGYFALNSNYHPADLPRVGAIAALVAWAAPAVYYLIFSIILGVVTLGIGLGGLVLCVVCGPVDLAIHAAFGALGAWLYGRFSGPRPDAVVL